MKNMDKKALKVKGARKAIQSLALVIGLSSILATANIGSKQYNDVINSSTQIEHDHDCDCDFCNDEIVVVTNVVENDEYLAKNTKTIEVKEFTQEEKEDRIDVNINNYNGTSIVEALSINGYESSFKYRKDLAIKLGITDYTGTAEQNIKMIELLNKKANEELTSKKTNNSKKNKGVKIQEIAAYLATIEGETFTSDKDAYNWAIKNNIIAGSYNYSLNKQDLCNVLISYASYKGVAIDNIDSKLNTIVKIFKDNQVVTNNINNLARAYYYGYIDVDKNNKVNAKNIVTDKDVNYAFTNLITDINIAIKSNNVDKDGKLIILPNEDKFARDSKDTTLINMIRNSGKEKPVTPSTPEVPSTPVENNDSNNKPGDDKEPSKPTPEHHHHYSAWRGVSDTQEERTCSCGHKETRGHVYGDWYSKDENTEGCKCPRCGWEKIRPKEDTHTHDWGEWQPYNETQCISYCNKPGCSESKKQSHDWGTPVTTHTDNHDGTHETVVKHTCKDCGYQTVISRTNDSCSYGPVSYSEITGTNQHYVIKNCTECGHEDKFAQDCDFGEFVYDPTSGVEVATCSKCGNKITRSHEQHQWSAWQDDETNNKCVRYCTVDGCTDSETKSHNYGEMRYVNDHYEEVCQDCGHVHSIDHIHSTSTFVVEGSYTNDANSYCYLEYDKCTIEGCTYSTDPYQVPHHWSLTGSTMLADEYTCDDCTATKTVYKTMMSAAPFMMSTPSPLAAINNEEIVPQDPEDQEQLPQDPENQEQHPINEQNQNNDVLDEIINEVIQEVINEQQNENQNQEEQNVQNDEPQESDGKTLELIP